MENANERMHFSQQHDDGDGDDDDDDNDDDDEDDDDNDDDADEKEEEEVGDDDDDYDDDDYLDNTETISKYLSRTKQLAHSECIIYTSFQYINNTSI
ncbi:hypothetical protein DPMN_001131 [Dreissena polymorpha]|uniref:Uncharacterized protein n=1 Tax=Dreissena polymorpha TaxID=45954 RepID=A0A9D4MIT1_DREPO|nr:hypothetical protein DPMN_001131 [Dreissena polymorpha]